MLDFNSKNSISNPYVGTRSYTEKDAIFFFGRETLQEEIINKIIGNRLTVIYGRSGVGKSSIIQAGIINYLRMVAQKNLENPKIGVPKLAVILFKDWQGKILENILEKVRDTIVDQISKAKGSFIEELCCIEELKNDLVKKARDIEEKNKLETGYLPCEFIQKLKAWTKILGKNYKTNKLFTSDLFIILDQFEGYLFGQRKIEDKSEFNQAFAEMMNLPGLSLHILIAIRSERFSDLDKHFKRKISSILVNTMEVEYLDGSELGEVISKPIDMYNFVSYINTHLLTVLTGHKYSGKSLFLKSRLTPYYQYDYEEIEGFKKNSSPFYPIYFNFVNVLGNDPASKLIERIKDRISTELDKDQRKQLHQLNSLKDVLEFSRRNFKELLIILDQFEFHLKSFFSEEKAIQNNLENQKKGSLFTFEEQLKEIFECPELVAHFLISISSEDSHVNSLSQLESFSKYLKTHHWEKHYKNYFELSKGSLAYLVQDQSDNFRLARLKNEDNFVNIVSERVKLGELDQSSKLIVSHYLQLIMERLWEESNISKSQDKAPILSLDLLQNIARKDSIKTKDEFHSEEEEEEELIDEGFSIILQEYVDRAIESASKESISHGFSGNRQALDMQISQILYYLMSRYSGQGCPPSDTLVKSANEEIEAFNLPLYKLKEKDVDKFLKKLLDKRVFRLIGFSRKDKDLYEVYFGQLREAIQTWQRQFLSQLRKASLPANAIAQSKQGRVDLGALLAIEAHKSQYIFDPDKYLSQVDATVREILKAPYFSCLFDCHDINQEGPKKDFWQVKFHPDGTMLVASNQDGSLWIWDVEQETASKQKVTFVNRIAAHYPNEVKNEGNLDIAITFSRDGDKLISSGRDGEINIWNISTLKANSNDIRPSKTFKDKKFKYKDNDGKDYHSDGFPSVVTFTQNGKEILAAGDWRGNVWLWDINQPQESLRPIKAPKSFQVEDESEEVWRGQTKGYRDWIWSVDVDSTGSLMAAGGRDKIIYIWNIEDFSKPLLIKQLQKSQELQGHEDEIFCVKFAPKEKLLASSSRDHTIRLWDLKGIDKASQTKELCIKTFKGPKEGHNHHVRALAFDSTDSIPSKLASASEDQTIRVWELNLENLQEKPKAICTPLEVLRGHSYGVSSVTFHPKNPQLLVSSGWDRSIRFWTLGADPEIFNVSKEDPCTEVRAVTWINEQEFALVRSDGIVELRRAGGVTSSDKSILLSLPSLGPVSKVIFSGSGQKQKMAVGDSNAAIRLLDIDFHELKQDKKMKEPKILKGHEGNKITPLAFSSDEGQRLLASVGVRKTNEAKKNIQTVELWNCDQLKPESIESMHLTYELPDASEREDINQFESGYITVNSIAFYPHQMGGKTALPHLDQRYLALASSCGDVNLWLQDIDPSVSNGIIPQEPRNTHGQAYKDTSVLLVFSQDGNWLASVSQNDDLENCPCVRLWNSEFLKQSTGLSGRCYQFCEHEHYDLRSYNLSPTSLAFSSNSKNVKEKWLAVGYYDGSIQMWSLEKFNRRQKLKTKPDATLLDHKDEPDAILRGHDEKVVMLAFSPSGRKLMSASDDNTVCIWTVTTNDLALELESKLYRDFREKEWQEFLGDFSQMQNQSELS